ncbi:MAG: PQQ-binding-like beta-propeller repeat protein [Pseudomonadales bacterium]
MSSISTIASGVASTAVLLLCIGSLGACSNDNSVMAKASDLAQALKPDAVAGDEWRHYLSGSDHSHFSQLDQINVSNVQHLQKAWSFDAGALAGGFSSEMQCNPLIIRGILYCTSPTLEVFALNAATGAQLWRFDAGFSASSMLPNANRGLSFWDGSAAIFEPGESSDQRILFTAGGFLFAINALTGESIRSFGNDGRVDLHVGLPEWSKDALVVATTPGTVHKNLLIMGTRVSEFNGSAPGHVRAFDVVSGEIRWIFHTIPKPGDFGADTWPADAYDRVGGANSWAGIAVDHERGIAYVPTGSPTFDFNGADRLGNNLFANSLVALNAETGERVWHYQFVRHDVWDRDLPSPPNLLDWPIADKVDGKAGSGSGSATVPAVVQATKSGHIFVFNRVTGEPLTPIHKQPVVGNALGGDVVAPWQPVPEFPTFANQTFEVTDRDPKMQAAVQQRISKYPPHEPFRPPSFEGTIMYPGIDGGAEWGGMAFDPSIKHLFINSNEVPYVLQMVELKGDPNSPEFAYLMMCAGCHGVDRQGDSVSVPSLVGLFDRLSIFEAWKLISEGRRKMPSFAQTPAIARAAILYHLWFGEEKEAQGSEQSRANAQQSGRDEAPTEGTLVNAGYQKLLDPENMPASKPPWGTLTAINIENASISWRIPLGDYPQMLEQGISGLGAENYGGPIVTAGNLLFIAATPDKQIRALDKRTGQLLWSAELPFAGFATPSTYMVDGVQYLVIAAGGGKLNTESGSQYLAFALPPEKR